MSKIPAERNKFKKLFEIKSIKSINKVYKEINYRNNVK